MSSWKLQADRRAKHAVEQKAIDEAAGIAAREAAEKQAAADEAAGKAEREAAAKPKVNKSL
jgi:hypothetical protein